ncbi:Hypothetical predicted protein [Cloeon dipterum]|uniref:C2H2-type domain-containing protein n=1 Tax=Cloeon dipterum TaxID=197152 RepID=A0A8S1BVE6_9INSE|nr:Hypothetical predicted protein [Cloeon dipterum]
MTNRLKIVEFQIDQMAFSGSSGHDDDSHHSWYPHPQSFSGLPDRLLGPQRALLPPPTGMFGSPAYPGHNESAKSRKWEMTLKSPSKKKIYNTDPYRRANQAAEDGGLPDQLLGPQRALLPPPTGMFGSPAYPGHNESAKSRKGEMTLKSPSKKKIYNTDPYRRANQAAEDGGLPDQLLGPQRALLPPSTGMFVPSAYPEHKGSAKSRKGEMTLKSPSKKKIHNTDPYYRRAPAVEIKMYQPSKVEMNFESSCMQDPHGMIKHKVAKQKSTDTKLKISAPPALAQMALPTPALKCHRCNCIISGPTASQDLDKHLKDCGTIKCVLCGNKYKTIKTLQNHQAKAHADPFMNFKR